MAESTPERVRAALLQERLGIMVQASGRGYAIVDYDALERLATVLKEPLTHPALARVLFERAQDGYVNPAGGKTTGRDRRDA